MVVPNNLIRVKPSDYKSLLSSSVYYRNIYRKEITYCVFIILKKLSSISNFLQSLSNLKVFLFKVHLVHFIFSKIFSRYFEAVELHFKSVKVNECRYRQCGITPHLPKTKNSFQSLFSQGVQ